MPNSRIGCLESIINDDHHKIRHKKSFKILSLASRVVTNLFTSIGTFTSILALTALVFSSHVDDAYKYLVMSVAGLLGLIIFIEQTYEATNEIKEKFSLEDKIDQLKLETRNLLSRKNEVQRQLNVNAEMYLIDRGLSLEYQDILLKSYTQHIEINCNYIENATSESTLKNIGLFLKRTHDIMVTAAALEGITQTSDFTGVELNKTSIALATTGAFIVALVAYIVNYFFFKKTTRQLNILFDVLVDNYHKLIAECNILMCARDRLLYDNYITRLTRNPRTQVPSEGRANLGTLPIYAGSSRLLAASSLEFASSQLQPAGELQDQVLEPDIDSSIIAIQAPSSRSFTK